jgi:hypothetical protein
VAAAIWGGTRGKHEDGELLGAPLNEITVTGQQLQGISADCEVNDMCLGGLRLAWQLTGESIYWSHSQPTIGPTISISH